jgi:beta-RFAP synthase
MMESNRGGPADSLTISAPARLHMGFLDPSGTLGRFFGSIGVSLNEIETRITLRPSERLLLPPEHRERCEAIVQKVSEAMGIPVSAEIIIDDSIPEHVGLGSGTQFALALGLGLHRLYRLNPSVREIAHLIGRGRRSGVGIAAFEQGGFVVDGGHVALHLMPLLPKELDERLVREVEFGRDSVDLLTLFQCLCHAILSSRIYAEDQKQV